MDFSGALGSVTVLQLVMVRVKVVQAESMYWRMSEMPLLGFAAAVAEAWAKAAGTPARRYAIRVSLKNDARNRIIERRIYDATWLAQPQILWPRANRPA
jgi:hypothetical protein